MSAVVTDSPDTLTQAQSRFLRLKTDFEFFSAKVLKIRTKTGEIAPFVLNRCQTEVLRRMREQKAKTGKVRLIVLKARQGGISTLMGAHFYHETIFSRGQRTVIMTHRDDATLNLFEMVQRFYDYSPGKLTPQVALNNRRELDFAKLDSGYRVATAKGRGAGRASTVQRLHASEFAFWDNAEEEFAGMGQTVPDMPNTEIVIESTANGVGNRFHRLWQDTIRGETDYQAVFIPWTFIDEYTKEPPEGWAPDAEDLKLEDLYGWTRAQTYWRHRKIMDDFGGDSNWFCQEYPMTAIEAFMKAAEGALIKPQYVYAAQQRGDEVEPYGPLLVGVDPAEGGVGGDRHGLVFRQGPLIYECESFIEMTTMEFVGEIVGRLKLLKLPKSKMRIFVDVTGVGAGVAHRLEELGYTVVRVRWGSKPKDKTRYRYLKDEAWDDMREWYENDNPRIPPKSDELQEDTCAPKATFLSDSRMTIESKDQLKRRGIRSPDCAEAVAATFAYPTPISDTPNELPPEPAY